MRNRSEQRQAALSPVSLQSLSIAPLMLEIKTTLAGAELPGNAVDSAWVVCWLAGNLAEPVHLPGCGGSACRVSGAVLPASTFVPPPWQSRGQRGACCSLPLPRCPPCWGSPARPEVWVTTNSPPVITGLDTACLVNGEIRRLEASSLLHASYQPPLHLPRT